MKTPTGFPVYPPRFLIRIFNTLRNYFLRLNRRFTHPAVVLWEMVHQFWLAAGIGVVADLGIADLLAGGSRNITDLARETGTDEESLYRIMRMLASQGIFREKGNRIFYNTRLAEALQGDRARYLVLLHLTPYNFRRFASLPEIVRTGEQGKGAPSGKDLFDHISDDGQRSFLFNQAMTNATWMQVPALFPAFPFRRYRNIIDVGGGQGLFLAALLAHLPGSRGIVFDLPGALAESEKVIAQFSLQDRMETSPGDFFAGVPEGGDLYLLKSVLHDWNDEDAVKILIQVGKAMNKDARLLVIEVIISEADNRPSFGKMTDILMMVTAGGKERTRVEYEKLLSEAGFRVRKVHPTVSPQSLIEAVPVFH
jgi:hypothetical protein